MTPQEKSCHGVAVAVVVVGRVEADVCHRGMKKERCGVGGEKERMSVVGDVAATAQQQLQQQQMYYIVEERKGSLRRDPRGFIGS